MISRRRTVLQRMCRVLANRVVYFETSRGCPFSCQFCLSSIEVGVRYFDMERTKSDLLYLIDSGAKLIKFVDRTFNIKRDYAMEIFRVPDRRIIAAACSSLRLLRTLCVQKCLIT